MAKDHDDDNDLFRKGTLPTDPGAGTHPMPRPPAPAKVKPAAASGPARDREESCAPWEAVIPFGRFELPSFPVERLPDPLRHMVDATARATQTPPDMAAMLSLSAISVCCGGRVEVEVAPDYIEPVNSYVAVAMEPGNRKTAVARLISSPIEEFERDQLEQIGPRIARERAEREALEERLEHLKKQAGRTEDAEERARLRDEAGDVAEQLARTPRPELPRLLADDVTPEVVPLLMAGNGGRLGIISAEGGLFDTIAGRYSNGVPNLDAFLKGHAGDPIRVDRRNGTAVHIDTPALTIGLAIQPEVLQGMSSKPGFAGRGLIPRFWFSLPVSLIGSREPTGPSIPPQVRAAYAERLRRLLCLEVPAGKKARLLLSTPAVERWRAFYGHTERAMRPDGQLASIREWASKLPGAVARIAALLHCAETGGSVGAVSVPTMDAAIEIGRYLSAHALAAHDAMGADPAVEDARKFVAWLERRRLATFTVREAYQSLKGGRIRKVHDLEPALRAAESHGYVRLANATDQRKGGRPTSPRYETNPEVLRSDPFPQSPQNPQNGASPGRIGGIGGNGGSLRDPTFAGPSGGDLDERVDPLIPEPGDERPAAWEDIG
jgi:replicative DNA helicase